MDLKSLMEQKKGKEIPEDYKNAKMSMLQALRDEMSKMMGEDMKNGAAMKQVSVAAPDKDSLAAGLDQAKDLVAKGQADDMDSDKEEDPTADDASEEEDGGKVIEDMIQHEGKEGELSDEEIDSLMALLQKMKMSKGMK